MKPGYTDEDLRRARAAWKNWHHDPDGETMPQVIARLIAAERERCIQQDMATQVGRVGL